MHSATLEMIVSAAVGGLLLIQFIVGLLRRRRRRPSPSTAGPGPEGPPVPLPAGAIAPRFAEALKGHPGAPRRPPLPSRVVPVRATPVAADRRMAPRAHRFSRRTLLPHRRAMRAAVVAAAILAPCHAHRR